MITRFPRTRQFRYPAQCSSLQHRQHGSRWSAAGGCGRLLKCDEDASSYRNYLSHHGGARIHLIQFLFADLSTLDILMDQVKPTDREALTVALLRVAFIANAMVALIQHTLDREIKDTSAWCMSPLASAYLSFFRPCRRHQSVVPPRLHVSRDRLPPLPNARFQLSSQRHATYSTAAAVRLGVN